MAPHTRATELAIAFLALVASTASAYTLERSTIGAAHGPCTHGTVTLQSSVGQSLIGRSTGVLFTVHLGYWGSLDLVSDVELPQTVTPTALGYNHPNPFNPLTVIPFSIGGMGTQHTTLRIYDLRGTLVRTLVDDERLPGLYHVHWNGTDDNGMQVATGVYFVRLATNHATFSRKLLLVK